MRHDTSTTKLTGLLLDAAAVGLFVLGWQALPRLGGLFETFVAPPTTVAATLFEMAKTGELGGHVSVSLGRAASGFALAAAVGVPLAFLVAERSSPFERVTRPLFRFLSKVNPFSLLPLFVVLFGIGERSKVAMVFWVCLWPILFHTTTGVREVDPLLIRAARSFGCSRASLFLHVLLPAASPGIFTGLKVGAGTAFFMLIAAEMIGASRGLGWLVWNAQMNFLIPRLFAATVCISLLGLSLNALLAGFERRYLSWRPTH